MALQRSTTSRDRSFTGRTRNRPLYRGGDAIVGEVHPFDETWGVLLQAHSPSLLPLSTILPSVREGRRASGCAARLEQPLDRRAMTRSRADVYEPHDAGRIDEHVTPLLHRIGDRPTRETAPHHFANVGEKRGRPEQVSPPRRAHPICAVERTRLVAEHRPARLRLGDVRARDGRGLERHHEDTDRQRLELPVPRAATAATCLRHGSQRR